MLILRETETPRGSRYYVNGRRVGRAAMRQVKADARRCEER